MSRFLPWFRCEGEILESEECLDQIRACPAIDMQLRANLKSEQSTMRCPVCGRSADKEEDSDDQEERSRHKYCSQCRMKQVEFLLEEGLDRETFLTTWRSVSAGSFADVRLVAKHGEAVSSHKAVLAGRSPVFHSLFSMGAEQDDCRSKVILEVPELNYEGLLGFVRFFYTGTVQVDVMKKYAPDLLGAAIKFEVKYLQGLCEKYVQDRATWNRKNLIWAFQVAKESGSEPLLSFCENHAKRKLVVRNLDWALEVAYKSGSKMLMEAALKMVLPRVHQLLTFDDSKKGDSHALCGDTTQLLKAYQVVALKTQPKSRSLRSSSIKSPFNREARVLSIDSPMSNVQEVYSDIDESRLGSMSHQESE